MTKRQHTFPLIRIIRCTHVIWYLREIVSATSTHSRPTTHRQLTFYQSLPLHQTCYCSRSPQPRYPNHLPSAFIALILCISGAVTRLPPTRPIRNLAKPEIRAGIIMFVFIYIGLFLLHHDHGERLRQIPRGERRMFRRHRTSLPFLAVRHPVQAS